MTPNDPHFEDAPCKTLGPQLEQLILAALREVDTTDRPVPTRPPPESLAGRIETCDHWIQEYRLSNGMLVAVFFDGGEWDYIEWVTIDGTRWEVPQGAETTPPLLSWRPIDNAPWLPPQPPPQPKMVRIGMFLATAFVGKPDPRDP